MSLAPGSVKVMQPTPASSQIDERCERSNKWVCGLWHSDPMKVALMVTCVNDAMFPETGKAVVRLLRRLGVDVDFPAAQTCCAQPMVNTGYLDEAVPAVRTFVDTFEPYDAVVTPSGSCAGSVRHQHAIVARRTGDAALVERVARTSPRTYELTEFLVDVLGVEDVGAYFPHRVTYHPTCHSLRMLGVGNRPRTLLEAVRGLRLVDLRGGGGDRALEAGVAGPARDDPVLVAGGPGARAGRRHDRVVPGERLDEGAHHRDRLVEVAGVDHRLRAAGLGLGEVDVHAEAAQQRHHGLPGAREHRVVDAGDHQGDLHGVTVP